MVCVAILSAVMVPFWIRSLVMNPVAKLAVVSVLTARFAEVNEFRASLLPVIVPLMMCSLEIELSAILSPVMAPLAILEDVIALSAILSTVMAKGAIFSFVTAPFWIFWVLMIPFRLILNATLIHLTM
jgi:hypothetical protein